MVWKRSIVSLIIASVISFIVLQALNDFGITWDEPIYFRSADRYIAWLQHPILEEKDKFFKASTDDVHPPFRKLVAGITHNVLTTQLKIVDNTRGYRISSLLFVFPFIFLFSYVAIGYLGYAFGICIPILFSLLPHVFYLAPLMSLDYAVVVLWFMAVITGLRGMKSYGWLIISAISIGLAMLTKLHGFVLLIPIGILWLLTYWKRLIGKVSLGQKTICVVRMIFVLLLSLSIYFIGWPWLWTSTIPHFKEYLLLQTSHVGVPVMIFGQSYNHVGWWYVPVMFFVTTPAFVLLFFVYGSWQALKRGSVKDRIFLINALFPMAFFMLPMVNRYDWVRLFLPAFPFVCLIAGLGMVHAVKLLQKRRRLMGTIVIFCIWLLTVYFSVVRIHPWESAYYNEFVGGIPGAYKLGFETEFWGNSYVGILPWMNANKKEMMCVTPTTQPFYYYQAMGQIEGGVVFNAGLGACKYVVVLMRQGLFIKDPFIDWLVKTRVPIETVSVQGVTLVGVYDISDIKN